MSNNAEKFLKGFQKAEIAEYPNYVKDFQPLVSIVVTTFQHEKYIAKCLDSILDQKTSFYFEIILGDDDSTDRTRQICIQYADRNSDKIKLLFHKSENNIKIDGNRTGRFNFTYGLFTARAKYIALCEGDDYWIDEFKLQKQVDFLEKNQVYGSIFTFSMVLNQAANSFNQVKLDSKTVNLTDLIINNILGSYTANALFKKEILKFLPENFLKSPFGDWYLWLFFLPHSIYVLPEYTSVYRITGKGAWSSLDGKAKEQKIILFYFNIIEITKVFLSEISKNERKELRIRMIYNYSDLGYNKLLFLLPLFFLRNGIFSFDSLILSWKLLFKNILLK